MISRTTLKYITPFLLFFLFLIDAHVTRLITALTNNSYVANAHLALLVLLIVSRVVNERFLLGTSLVLGILYDLYYIGVIGIYAVIFPLLVMMFYFFKKTIQQNILTLFFTIVILIFPLEKILIGPAEEELVI